MTSSFNQQNPYYLLPVRSLLDVDFYKLTMCDFVLKLYPDLTVKYAFKNRTKDVKLARIIDPVELQNVFDNTQEACRLNPTEYSFLKYNKHCKEVLSGELIKFLFSLKLPKVKVGVTPDGDQLTIETEGKWAETILWETIVLATVNELYTRIVTKDVDGVELQVESEHRLWEKIKILRGEPDIKFMEFGTRRRYSRLWQYDLTELVAEKLPENFLGTSNTRLALDLELKPMGTMAHELLMVTSAVANANSGNVPESQFKVFEQWHDHFSGKLSIALTDTFGTKAFLDGLTPELANKLTGVRQDSGDPFEYALNYVTKLHEFGIDPKTKTIVFSDGLDVPKMLDLIADYGEVVNVVFGWGTNLTNDTGYNRPLSIVMKAVEVTGCTIAGVPFKEGTVKLSDNLEKATGTPDDIANYKRMFGYTGTNSEICIY